MLVASEEELERIAQDRAAKCITIAQALLGKKAAYNPFATFFQDEKADEGGKDS